MVAKIVSTIFALCDFHLVFGQSSVRPTVVIVFCSTGFPLSMCVCAFVNLFLVKHTNHSDFIRFCYILLEFSSKFTHKHLTHRHWPCALHGIRHENWNWIIILHCDCRRCHCYRCWLVVLLLPFGWIWKTLLWPMTTSRFNRTVWQKPILVADSNPSARETHCRDT